MNESTQPQLYLITPSNADIDFYQKTLAPMLDKHPIACIRLGLITDNESTLYRHGNQLREIAHARDISVVITSHYRLVKPLGFDGVHRIDAGKTIRTIRTELGSDAIIGTHCGISRHAGLNAGEIGADYISFGPLTKTALNDDKTADIDLFEWWHEIIETPVVAEGNITLEMASTLSSISDFIALGNELWSHENPLDILTDYMARLT